MTADQQQADSIREVQRALEQLAMLVNRSARRELNTLLGGRCAGYEEVHAVRNEIYDDIWETSNIRLEILRRQLPVGAQ